MIGGVREILGAGAFFGIPLFGPNFQPWVIMVLPPGGFFVMAGWLLLFVHPAPARANARRRPTPPPSHRTWSLSWRVSTLAQILLTTILSGNFVLAMFLGMCPFLGVTHSVSVAFPLGLATTFVIIIASLSAYLLNWLLGDGAPRVPAADLLHRGDRLGGATRRNVS